MEDHEQRAEQLEAEADELERRGERVERDIDETREESEQLPEQGPAEQVPDDAPERESREEASRSPGVPGETERGTGHAPDELAD